MVVCALSMCTVCCVVHYRLNASWNKIGPTLPQNDPIEMMMMMMWWWWNDPISCVDFLQKTLKNAKYICSVSIPKVLNSNCWGPSTSFRLLCNWIIQSPIIFKVTKCYCIDNAYLLRYSKYSAVGFDPTRNHGDAKGSNFIVSTSAADSDGCPNCGHCPCCCGGRYTTSHDQCRIHPTIDVGPAAYPHTATRISTLHASTAVPGPFGTATWASAIGTSWA